MATEQTIQWVALPNGFDENGALRLSVFVAPRLRSDEAADLSPFADWLDWPARVAAASFEVEVDGQQPIAAVATSAPPESRLWQALFSAQTPVRPFVFDDLAERPIVSFDARAVAGFIRERYGRLAAAAADDLPLAVPPPGGEGDSLAGLFAELVSSITQRVGRIRGGPQEYDPEGHFPSLLDRARSLAAARRADPGVAPGPPLEPLPADGTPATEFDRLRLFHYRPPGEPHDLGDDAQATERFRAEFDFHQMLSALGDHPALLRRLGLVIDLVVPAEQLPLTDEFRRERLRVLPRWDSAIPEATSDRTPWTQYVHSVDERLRAFVPLWRGANGIGFLQLPPDAFEALQLDLDGAALKLLGMASTLAGRVLNPERPIDEDGRTGAPALRTGGIGIVAGERARQISEAFAQASALNSDLEAGAENELFAEELTRAFRLDIRDADGAWRSLHQRIVRYSTLADPEAAPPPISDEGWSQISLTEPAVAPGQPPDPNSELYLHEQLLSWDGWSLSAPRPGKSISRSPRAPTPDDPATQPQRVENQALTALPLTIDAEVQPGTLPRLRFGRPYRLRLRTVDLAGNGPTLAEADALFAVLPEAGTQLPPDAPLVFRRFEPVAAPALAPRARYGEGESLERLVIRSNFDRAAAAEAAELNALVNPAEPYGAVCERHLLAPKVALDLIEKHGMLDAAFDARRNGLDEGAARALAQEAYAIARREKGSLDDASIPGAELVTIPGSAPEEPPQRYAVHRAEQLALPYLPDPLATGAILYGLPGVAPGEPTVVRFDGASWHEAPPFRLRLEEGAGAPEWDAAARVLAVRLGKAEVATVRVSSLLGGELDLMALWRWCEELRNLPAPVLDDNDLERIARAAKESRHWMFTPWRTLTLVHAVRQPLEQPEIVNLEALRHAGATTALLRGELLLHRASTERADLEAAWGEWIDDLTQPGPEWREQAAPVFSIPLDTAAASQRPNTLTLEDDRLLRFNSVAAEDQRIDFPPPHQFGDTKHRVVRYSFYAATRFRDYLPAALTANRDAIARVSKPLTLALPSTAPPPPPRVQYIVPTFSWETTRADDGTISSVRRGGGLRVYLDRPWYASGEGELLGAILRFAGPPLDPKHAYASVFGRDPLWSSPPVAMPQAASFLNAATVSPPLPLLEIDAVATVVGFAPEYDAVGRRWFCDLQLDTGNGYFPFVRLALVRYQPNALGRTQLSRVTFVDSVQVFPDRSATIGRDPADAATLQIAVLGISYDAVAGGAAGERVERAEFLSAITAELERRVAAIADPLLGWERVVGSATELEAQRSPDGQTAWTGALRIPDELAGVELRLVLIERERFMGDGLGEVGERTVYLDVVGL